MVVPGKFVRGTFESRLERERESETRRTKDPNPGVSGRSEGSKGGGFAPEGTGVSRLTRGSGSGTTVTLTLSVLFVSVDRAYLKIKDDVLDKVGVTDEFRWG